jgi:type VI secretion system protein ImpL
VFQEAGLAGVNRRAQLQRAALQSAAFVGCAAVLLFGSLALLVSYGANANYIDEVARAAADLKTTELGVGAAGLPLEAFLPRLDALRTVTDAAEKYRDRVPWRMRMGLYRGQSLGAAARDAYVREANGVLPPFLDGRFEQELQSSVATPDRLYEYLKGYLMLADGGHRNPRQLQFLAGLEWAQLFPQDGATARRFAEHFQQLFTDGDRLTSQPVNRELVEQARSALHNASLALLMYSRLKLGSTDDARSAARLDIEAGSGAALIFVRRSGKPLSEPVPALYTRPVFEEINAVGKYRLIKQFAEDSWVLGDNAFDLVRGRQLISEVMDVYEQDYIDNWDAVLKDFMLKPTATVRDLTEVLGIAASPASPLKGLLSLVDRQTELLAADSSAAAKLASAAADRAQILILAKTFGGDENRGTHRPGAKVAAHFAPIHELLAGTVGRAPIDSLLAALARTHDQLQSIGSGLGETSALDALTRSGQADALQSLDLVAKGLPPPVGDMIGQFGVRTVAAASTEARGDLARRYDEQVLHECQQLVTGRYPLNHDSSSDVPLEDFAQLFGPAGVFEKFRDNLAALVDTSSSPWRWRQGAAPIGGSNALLRQFELVKGIRDAYFKETGRAPEAHFFLTPESLDATSTRFTLAVDGQVLEYRHGPQQARPFVWPGASPDASFSFEVGGASSPGSALQGPWAWFRLLDRAAIQRLSETRYLITFSTGDRSMRVILDAASSRNPFGQNPFAGFRCAMSR